MAGRAYRPAAEAVMNDLTARDGVQRGVVGEELDAVVDAVEVDVEGRHVGFLGLRGGGARDEVEDVVAVVDAGV